MTHRPFDDWLFEPQELSPEEDQALQDHLAVCPDCRALAGAWQSIAGGLMAAEPADPQPGFVTRWQARLAQAKARRKQRRSWVVLGAIVFGAVLLAPFFGLRLWALLDSPTTAALEWLAYLQSLSDGMQGLLGFLAIVVRALRDVHLLWWVALGVLALSLSGLWTGLLYRFAFKSVPNGVSQ
jgi:anti-sigma factor RsiW